VDGFESTDMLLIGAPMQLNLVLLNLVSNAAKFTTKGAITFSVTVEEEASDWAKVKFAVTDTGVGIPIDEHESIFEMRSQTGGLVSQSKGFGIGLNIASKLTGLMGGRLEVKSPVKDGKGSEFSFTLSLKKAAEQHKVEEGVEEGEAGLAPIVAPPMHLRVLIVDDGKMNQKLLRRKFEGGVFEALRWSVDIAINGEQALEKIDAGGEFDLIVMDENMRETGGRLLGTEGDEADQVAGRSGKGGHYRGALRELDVGGQGEGPSERPRRVLGEAAAEERADAAGCFKVVGCERGKGGGT